jgi:hypothetical protein
VLTVLSVAYPFAPVGPDAVGGAEQILSAIDAALVRAGARSLVLACEGSQVAGKLLPVAVPEGSLTDETRTRVAERLRPEIEDIVAREHVDLVHFHGIGFARSLPDNDTPVLATLHLPPSWYAPEVFALRRPQVFPHPEHVRYFQEKIQPRIDPACFFIGPVTMPQKAGLLARARCLVVPSVVSETSSLVTMEALAAGTPVVALPKGALPDLIDHGRTGLLVNDVREMRDALLRAGSLSRDDCRREAEERFGQERMCARYLAAYERLTSHARVPRSSVAVDEITDLDSLRELEPEWASILQGADR